MTFGGTNISPSVTSTTVINQTSASFSPPANSMVVVMAINASAGVNSLALGLSCKDSLSNTYAMPASQAPGGSYYGTAFFTYYYASAPGSITVTVTQTTASQTSGTSHDVIICPIVLTGAAASQAGAGVGMYLGPSFNEPNCECTIVTTTTGSIVLIIGNSGYFAVGSSFTADGNTNATPLANAWATPFGHAIFGIAAAATGTPGSTTVGWTNANSYYPNILALEILPGAVALDVATVSLPPALTGTAYSQPLSAIGGTGPYTWSISSGSLPGWASLTGTGNGTISGTPGPTDGGSTTFTVQVTDNVAATSTQVLTLNVATNSSPAYASSYGTGGGGSGSWVNPANAEGAPNGVFATWTAP
jgi:large repetitive protein